MITIVNYGLGNLHSVHKAVEFVGGRSVVTGDADELMRADKIILPGVGSFNDGMAGLQARGLVSALREAVQVGIPVLGICLGMQLMFQESEELGRHQGLGLLPGKVVLFKQPGIKVPQIGWNQIDVKKDTLLLEGITSGVYFYFNHSYYCVLEDPALLIAVTDYGSSFASVVQHNNLYGVQFHPEKSQKVGLKLLKNFVES